MNNHHNNSKIDLSSLKNYESILKLLEQEDIDDNKTNDLCLISGEKLNNTHIALECGHKFNYEPIVKEITQLKNKYQRTLESTHMRKYDIKCPYCRNIQNTLLPYLIGFPKFLNVNSPISKTYMPHNCKYKFKRGINKSKTCGEKCYGEYCLFHFKAEQKKKTNAKNKKEKIKNIVKKGKIKLTNEKVKHNENMNQIDDQDKNTIFDCNGDENTYSSNAFKQVKNNFLKTYQIPKLDFINSKKGQNVFGYYCNCDYTFKRGVKKGQKCGKLAVSYDCKKVTRVETKNPITRYVIKGRIIKNQNSCKQHEKWHLYDDCHNVIEKPDFIPLTYEFKTRYKSIKPTESEKDIYIVCANQSIKRWLQIDKHINDYVFHEGDYYLKDALNKIELI